MQRRHVLMAAVPLAAGGLLAGTAVTLADTAPSTSTLTQTIQGLTTTKSSTTTAPKSATSTASGTLTGTASAQVLQIQPLQTCVSCTSASAGPGTASSTATTLELFGSTVAGGDSKDNSSNNGAVLAIPANPLITAAILDWAADSGSTANASHSNARSAVADVSLADGQVATVTVLESDSHATYNNNGTTTTTTGAAQNNGAVVNLGQGALVIVLLHSDASNNGTSNSGGAYVASINGNEILSSSQTGGIPIDIPGVGDITLLAANASGGTSTAAVGTVSNLLGQNGQQVGALTSSGSGAKGSAQGITTPQGNGNPTPANLNNNKNNKTTASTSGPGIPFTGADLALGTGLLLMATGGAAAGAGAVLRRRRNSAVAED